MGLAVTLSLAFLWARFILLWLSTGFSFKSFGKAFVTLMVSKPERTYVYLYKLTVFSSTPILSKVLEDFVVSWMIEDVGEHIDSR